MENNNSITDKVSISDSFKIIGDFDEPPKKKDKSEIPINENDISDLDYITEG